MISQNAGSNEPELRDSDLPQGETESKLSAIWVEVLGVKQVGRHDDFFELGGNSLAVTQMISRIRTVFGVEIPLRQMFETSTVAGFAEYIGAIRWMSAESTSPEAGPDDDRTEIEL